MSPKTILCSVVIIILSVTNSYFIVSSFISSEKNDSVRLGTTEATSQAPTALNFMGNEEKSTDPGSGVSVENSNARQNPPVTAPIPSQSPTTVTPYAPAKATEPIPTPSEYTLSDIAKHATKTSCWTIIGGGVYDITAYVTRHPGGERNVLKICGKDGSSLFGNQHGGESKPESILERYRIGDVM